MSAETATHVHSGPCSSLLVGAVSQEKWLPRDPRLLLSPDRGREGERKEGAGRAAGGAPTEWRRSARRSVTRRVTSSFWSGRGPRAPGPVPVLPAGRPPLVSETLRLVAGAPREQRLSGPCPSTRRPSGAPGSGRGGSGGARSRRASGWGACRGGPAGALRRTLCIRGAGALGGPPECLSSQRFVLGSLGTGPREILKSHENRRSSSTG